MANIRSINANWTIFKTGYYTSTITLTDQNGKPIDITGYKFYLTIKTDLSVADGSATKQKNWTSHVSPTEGKTVMELTIAETGALTAGNYVYDVAFLDNSSPKKKYVIITGNLIVQDPVTQAVS